MTQTRDDSRPHLKCTARFVTSAALASVISLKNRMSGMSLRLLLFQHARFVEQRPELFPHRFRREPADARRDPFSLFSSITLTNFVDAWNQGRFGVYFVNTVLITGAT